VNFRVISTVFFLRVRVTLQYYLQYFVYYQACSPPFTPDMLRSILYFVFIWF